MWGVLLLVALCHVATGQITDVEQARLFLAQYNTDAQTVWPVGVQANWDYSTNITDHNLQRQLESAALKAQFDKDSAVNASRFAWRDFTDQALRREFSKIVDVHTAFLPTDKVNRVNKLQADMKRIYSVASVCDRPGYEPERCFPLDPDLTQILATSTDWDELVWAWEGWRNASGRKLPDLYEEFVTLQNEAAKINNYPDAGDYWRSSYEMEDLRGECVRLWEQLRPLYEQLHAYVLRKLKQRYAGKPFPTSGQIPAHLLGNMWAQSWGGVESLVRPFPDKPSVDVTPEMQRQGYNSTTMFRLSEEFFTSLGLIPMTDQFWKKSMIDKPSDRKVVCHASAWDFYNRRDFRIKQCTEVTMNWLITTHHEMGHVEYFLQYKDQPVRFRGGANHGFHEAIGDVLALSVATPEHLEKIGLLPNYVKDPEVDLNFLMSQALKKIAFIPFGYLIDQWRWDVFGGATPRAEYNGDWWKARCRYQGVSPPVQRSSSDFDAGAKFHVPNNTPYIRYFVSHIIQFQFHVALCKAAGHTGPLHSCDIYQSKDAGKLIGDMMKLGSSLPWPDAMEAIVGSRKMSAEPLVDYFQPLLDWLAKENEGQSIGWENDCAK